jgi:hypothetical protein
MTIEALMILLSENRTISSIHLTAGTAEGRPAWWIHTVRVDGTRCDITIPRTA